MLDFSRTILLRTTAKRMMQYRVHLQPLKICVETPKDMQTRLPSQMVRLQCIPTKNEAKEKCVLNVFLPVLALITVCYVQMNIQYGGQLVSESQKVDFLCLGWSKSIQTRELQRPVDELSRK